MNSLIPSNEILINESNPLIVVHLISNFTNTITTVVSLHSINKMFGCFVQCR